MQAHPYRRNLPHEFPAGTPIFFTWRLYGSMPARSAPTQVSRKQSPGEKFATEDRILDRAASGPRWLSDPRVAEMVTNEIERGGRELGRYELFEYVVMPNHVHLLVYPHTAPDALMKLLKGITARRANRILERSGQPFWQYESFDHWCRSAVEVRKIRGYIAENPVKCGLVQRAQDWPWSSVHRRLLKRQAKLAQRPMELSGREG
jgi:REP element-mobilizing transposase RayT